MDIRNLVLAEKFCIILKVCVRMNSGKGGLQMWTGVEKGQGAQKSLKMSGYPLYMAPSL